MRTVLLAMLAGAGSVAAAKYAWAFVARRSNTQVHQVRP